MGESESASQYALSMAVTGEQEKSPPGITENAIVKESADKTNSPKFNGSQASGNMDNMENSAVGVNTAGDGSKATTTKPGGYIELSKIREISNKSYRTFAHL
jgi:hypothetical protein